MHDLKPLVLLADRRFSSPVTALHMTTDAASVIAGHEGECFHSIIIPR